MTIDERNKKIIEGMTDIELSKALMMIGEEMVRRMRTRHDN